jgi:SAM-dependent methyltransferase
MKRQDQKRIIAGQSFSIGIGDRTLTQPDYVVCVEQPTGLLVRDPCLSDEDLAYYYEHNDWRNHRSHRLFPTEAHLREVLVASLPDNARVLDIGCGDGRLLASLPVSYGKYGTELSAGAAQEATRQGVEIISHERLVAGEAGCFDAIVMVDVFEHLKNPHKFIAELLPCLKPGGLLGIATGNGDFPTVREDAANFWYFRVIAHVCMWTEAYACFAERELGLERVATRRCSHYHFQFSQWLKQSMQKEAFDVFQRGKHRWLRLFLALIPGFRRAQKWTERPPYWFGRDHVVNVFRKAN